MGSKYDKYLNEKIKEKLKQLMVTVDKDFLKCARKTNKLMFKEVDNMYHTLIETFYEYHTVWYIRHEEVWPGTEHGENLFKGSRFKMDQDNRISPRLYVEFSGANMDGGYKFHTPDQVLNYVMNGVRFKMESGDSNEIMTVDPASMVYHGTYFSYHGGTIRDAFDTFIHNWNDISSEAFYSMWGDYVNKWTVKSNKKV